jgi:hypothetical protein
MMKKSPLPKNVVRVYRQEKSNPRKLVGVVEEVGVKGKRAFTNVDDLWEILCAPKGDSRGKQKSQIKENKAAKCASVG